MASDVVDTTTGEVLLEANSELTADKLAKILDATGVVELNVFFPERDDVGMVISQTLEARLGEDTAGSADRDLPQAASRRSADARHRDRALPRHVLRSAQVRLLARRPVEVQHQAVSRTRTPPSLDQPHAGAGGFLRHHPLPAQAAQEHRLGGRHRSPRQPPRARGRRTAGEPVPHRPGAHGARHQGKDERVPGNVNRHAARPGQRQAGDGRDPRVLRVVAAVAVHGPDQPAVGNHAQAASVGPWAGRSVARARRIRSPRRAPDALRPHLPD